MSLWQLHGSARERGAAAPYAVGLAGDVTAAVFLWLMVTGIVPLPELALYGAFGVLVAGSLQEIGARFFEACIVKVRREMAAGPEKGPPAQQLTRGAAISIAAAVFYGMYKSVDLLAPKAEGAEIACYGINACKGQTQCATAFNACPSQNACKGKGFSLRLGKRLRRPGRPLNGSPADPGRKA